MIEHSLWSIYPTSVSEKSLRRKDVRLKKIYSLFGGADEMYPE